MRVLSKHFTSDILTYLNECYEFFGYTPLLSGNLENDLLDLFTIQQKFIFPYQRKVLWSNELKDQMKGGFKYGLEILKLSEMFSKGENVNPHQSKELFNPKVHDQLVYDWHIYHLHLKFSMTQPGYFMDKGKDILFVFLHKGFAYFLTVLPHERGKMEVFADKYLLEIIQNNWPETLEKSNSIIDLSHHLDSKERFKLRKYGLNEGFVKVHDEIVINPGLGRATSGHSIEVVSKLNDFARWLNSFEKTLDEEFTQLNDYCISHFNLDSIPSYSLKFTEDGPEIWDSNSSSRILKYNHEIRFGRHHTSEI